MKLDVTLLDGTPDVVGAGEASAGVAAERLSAATNRRRWVEDSLAVEADPRVLLDRRELFLQRRVLLQQLGQVGALNFAAGASSRNLQ